MKHKISINELSVNDIETSMRLNNEAWSLPGI